MINEHHGGCLCGAVRFTVSGPLRGVIHCHCGQCLKTHGHAAAYTNAPRKALRFSREDGLRWFASSERARRGFCGECGASLFYEPHDSGTLSIAAGMFDRPSGLRSIGHIYVDHKSDYYEIADGLPQFPDSSEGKLEGDYS